MQLIIFENQVHGKEFHQNESERQFYREPVDLHLKLEFVKRMKQIKEKKKQQQQPIKTYCRAAALSHGQRRRMSV